MGSYRHYVQHHLRVTHQINRRHCQSCPESNPISTTKTNRQLLRGAAKMRIPVMTEKMFHRWICLVLRTDPRASFGSGQLLSITVLSVCIFVNMFAHMLIWQSVLTWLIGLLACIYFLLLENEIRTMRRCHRAISWCLPIVFSKRQEKVPYWLHSILTEVLERQVQRTRSLYAITSTASCLLYLEARFDMDILKQVSFERSLENCESHYLPQEHKLEE